MHIVYDLTATQPTQSKFHGGGEYGKVVFRRLVECNEQRTDATAHHITGLYRSDRWLDPSVEQSASGDRVRLAEWDRGVPLGQCLRELDASRFYSALPYEYGGEDFRDIELVVTVHGLRPIELATDRFEYRYDRSLRGWAKYAAKHLFTSWYTRRHRDRFEKLVTADAQRTTIVVPSRHTKYALLDRFPSVENETIRVLYSPEQSAVPAEERALDRYGIVPNRYVLLVSGDRWIKNAYRAVRALDQLFDQEPELSLDVVVTGVEQPRSIFGRLDHPARFQFLDYVDRPVLEALYEHAYALLYPTLNEGFGYPPLEAMRYGTPVLCSAVTSLPEICEDAALYFDPYSEAEIRNRVHALASETALHETFSERARRRYATMAEKQSAMLQTLCDLLLSE